MKIISFVQNNILQTSPEQIEYAKLGEEKEEFYNKEIKSSYIVRTIDNLIEKASLSVLDPNNSELKALEKRIFE